MQISPYTIKIYCTPLGMIRCELAADLHCWRWKVPEGDYLRVINTFWQRLQYEPK